jgi:hypothetical protein
VIFHRIDERGQAAVEFVLCLPIVALGLGVLIEIGLLVGDHVRLWHAARESARIAIVDSDPDEIQGAAEQGGLSPLTEGRTEVCRSRYRRATHRHPELQAKWPSSLARRPDRQPHIDLFGHDAHRTAVNPAYRPIA